MSVGFGVGDFLAVFELAGKIRKKWVDAPLEYTSMKNEIKNVESVLRDIDELRQQTDLNQRQNDDLQYASKSCRDVLERCSEIVDKYSSATGSKNGTTARVRRTWRRFQSDPDDVRHVRNQLLSLMGQLTALRDAVHSDLLLDVDEKVEHVYSDTQILRARDDAREKEAIAYWFSESKFADQQNEFMKQRQPGTGQWLLQDGRYQSWSRQDGSPPVLLCPGIPGSGKTMMVAAIITDLREHFLQDNDTIVIYFYCNFNRKDEQDLEQLYACFVRQLLQEQLSTPREAEELYLKHKNRSTRPPTDELIILLRALVQRYKRVFVLVDALDECNIDRNCRGFLINELISLASNKPRADVKVLCTTRFIPEIIQKFSAFPHINVRAHKEDIDRYLDARISEIACIETRADLQEDIKTQIIGRADGMFLLARLYFDSLLGCTKPKAVRNILAGLPRGEEALFKMYETARARIDHQLEARRELAHKVLGWITYARRELSIEELQEAVATEPEMTDLDHNDDIDNEDTIVSVCAGLVTVDKETHVVRLVHLTTQEYLEKVRAEWFPFAQIDIVQSCLVYLSMKPFQAVNWRIDLSPYVRKYKFLHYAAQNWGFHLLDVDDSAVRVQARQFLCNDARSQFASQVMMTAQHMGTEGCVCSVGDITLFHISAYFNIWEICRNLMATTSRSYDLKDSRQRTPLSWAAERGGKEVAELLLRQSGVEANSKDVYGWTPLWWAASNGDKEMVELLLRQPGVEANSKDVYGWTPLSWAASSGDKEMVELLLRQPGVEANSKDVYGWTPLWWAASSGDKEMVELLLRQPGVKVDSKDKDGWTPLSRAASNGGKEVVELLLRQPEVEVDVKDACGWTPLLWAVYKGHQEVVELLNATKARHCGD